MKSEDQSSLSWMNSLFKVRKIESKLIQINANFKIAPMSIPSGMLFDFLYGRKLETQIEFNFIEDETNKRKI